MRVKVVSFGGGAARCSERLMEILAEYKVECTIERFEEFSFRHLDVSVLQKLRQVLRKNKNEFIVFIPNITELYLKQPDLTLVFAGYRSWCDSERIKVIPHTQTPVVPSSITEEIRWVEKPKLTVGFMGNSFESSIATRLAARLPTFLKKPVLYGWYLRLGGLLIRFPSMARLHTLIFRNLSFFGASPRIEAIKALQASDLDTEIVVREYFDGSDEAKLEYRNHLLRSTYVLCPKGAQNFSYRFYEALCYGRVPVLIDTDMMLPESVDWDSLCVRVPYEKLSELKDRVTVDYNAKTEAEFLQRQVKAIELMEDLYQEGWIREIAEQIVSQFGEDE